MEEELNALLEELKTKVPRDTLLKALNDLYFMPKSEFDDLVVKAKEIEETTNH